jgi:hypothetical protein
VQTRRTPAEPVAIPLGLQVVLEEVMKIERQIENCKTASEGLTSSFGTSVGLTIAQSALVTRLVPDVRGG